MSVRRFAEGWQRLAYRQLVRSLGDAARIDEAELLDLVTGRLDGVDPTRNATEDGEEWDDSTPEPVTPFEHLVMTGLIVRDFRDLEVWDRCRDYDPDVYGYPRDKSRGMSLGIRDWTKIDTIIIHTAAVDLGPDRGLGVPSHGLVDRDGGLVLQHYLQAYLASCHRPANSYTVNLEISGSRTIAAKQVPAARAWCRFAAETLRREHELLGVEIPIKVGTHRMTHKSRVNDCDGAIWREVGEWCIDELNCELADVVGSGRIIPAGWWTPGRQEAQP